MIRAARAAWLLSVSKWSAPSSDTKLRGCRAARKISLALAMPTVLSVGECMTISARCRVRIRSRRSAAPTSSTKFRLSVSALPPIKKRCLAVSLDPLDQRVVVVLAVGWYGAPMLATAATVRHACAGPTSPTRTAVWTARHHGVDADQRHAAEDVQ